MSFLSRFLRVANVRASSIVDGIQALELNVTHCNSLFSLVSHLLVTKLTKLLLLRQLRSRHFSSFYSRDSN